MKTKKNIIIAGDRVLVDLDDKIDRTTAGLYLPPTVKEKEKVYGGYVVKVGPGYPVHDPNIGDEAWTTRKQQDLKYIPLQASEGDYAIFLKEHAVEIEFSIAGTMPESVVLEALTVRLVADSERRRFDEALRDKHYLKNANVVGRVLRYVAEYRDQWVAQLVFSSSAFHLKLRDQWLQWSPRQVQPDKRSMRHML